MSNKELSPQEKESISKIEKIFLKQRMLLSSLGWIGAETGHRLFSPVKTYEAMLTLKNKKLIPEKGNFFDFGSGTGIHLMAATMQGYSSYGIEFNRNLEKEARYFLNDFQKRELSSKEIELKSLHGSYFPKEYIQKRLENKSIAKDYEINLSNELTGDIFFPVASDEEIYLKLGKNLSEIDLFYAYAWSIQTPSLLELFSIYSKQNAGFLICSAGKNKNHNELLKKLYLNSQKLDGTNFDFVTKNLPKSL